MSSFAPPIKKARRSHSNGAPADSDGEFFPGCVHIEYYFLNIEYIVAIWASAFCETAALQHRVCHLKLTEVWMFACILLGISKIEYKPDAGPGDNLCFKHYNPQEVTII